MFREVNQNQSFPLLEQKILEKWQKEGTFEKSLKHREGSKKGVFFDGPPFANGMPHYGHIMQSVMKDAVARFMTMRGFYVPRVAGWDCHGLPVENEVEKANDIKTKKDIEQIGVQKFCSDCRESVFTYKNKWVDTFHRIGRWVDVENGYATLNVDYMESIWAVFKMIWDKGLVYKGYKPMHISTALETPLSNFEVAQNYKDITDYTVTAKFELKDEPGVFLMAWTTTPWTLPGNQALAIGSDISYVKVRAGDEILILAKELVESVFGDREFEIIDEVKAVDLIGRSYVPLFPYYEGVSEKNFKIHSGNFVTIESGTGIVHIAGGFGEDDNKLVTDNGMEPIIHVKMNGDFKDEVTDFAGKYVKGQDQNIGKYLEGKGLLFSHSNHRHSYPHCWRTDTPLLNYVTTSWFIKVTDVKDKMMLNNQKINWQPEHLRDGRFGKWLEGARDWAISRNRYWGAPLPIWENENGDTICVGSLEELEKLAGKLPKNAEGETDLHKPWIDEITFMHPDHQDSTDEKYLMHRIPDVFDCWFESGSMPYAQLHYPFENKDEFENNFPADFIIEAIDQTRGWFYTLNVISTILFDQPAAKNIVTTGLILAEDGEKLSKRKKNYTPPAELFDAKGVDPVRFYICSSPVVIGESVRFSDRLVEEMLKKFNLTIWNTYSFFVTYANIDQWKPAQTSEKPQNELDKWILSELQQVIKEVTANFEKYNLMMASRPMLQFVDNLSNWYVRRSRRRFWKSENDSDKDQAYQTLYIVLRDLSKLIAPFMPFLAEEIYTNVTGEESVHLADWPEVDDSLLDLEINQQTEMVRKIVTLGHAVRDKSKIKVRQPLSLARIALPRSVNKKLVQQQAQVIAEELNVKAVEFIESAEGLVEIQVKPQAKVLGPKYGGAVQEIIKLAREGDFEMQEDKCKIGEYLLEPGEFELGYVSAEGVDAECEGGVTVILDTAISQDLLYEGYARDITRQVQELRKESDFNVSDHIILNIHAEKPLSEAVTKFADYIARETLADEIQQSGGMEDSENEKTFEVDGVNVKISLKRD